MGDVGLQCHGGSRQDVARTWGGRWMRAILAFALAGNAAELLCRISGIGSVGIELSMAAGAVTFLVSLRNSARRGHPA